MNSDNNQVEALKKAMLERARLLAEEHVAQGNLSRQKILQDAREKIHLMEQKELLLAKAQSEREYQRQLQASEIQMQAELDRNRWGLVQTVMNRLHNQLTRLNEDEGAYREVFFSLLGQALEQVKAAELIAQVNATDQKRFAHQWNDLLANMTDRPVRLDEKAVPCSGGIRLVSVDGDVMVDNTFENLLARQQRELESIIFERLFATVDGKGALVHG